MVKVSAIVLAGGESRRMADQNKLLASLGGQTLIARVLKNLSESMIDEIILVTGNQATLIGQQSAGYELQLVHNSEYKHGMSSSIRAGINALDEKVSAVMICQADMPFISPSTINNLINAFLDTDKIIWPHYEHRPGNPVLWPKRYFDQLLTLEGDRGAKQIFKQSGLEIYPIEIENIGIVLDIDNPQTLNFFQKILKEKPCK